MSHISSPHGTLQKNAKGLTAVTPPSPVTKRTHKLTSGKTDRIVDSRINCTDSTTKL